MRLLSTFYSTGADLDIGWWATIEYADGRRTVRYLWEDEAGPDFDDLAAVIAELAPLHGLDAALQCAREDAQLVGRTKALARKSPGIGWVH